MAKVISNKTHSNILKLLKSSIKVAKKSDTKNQLTTLVQELESAEIAIGYDD